MNQYAIRAIRRQGFQPEPNRVLPGRAAADRRGDAEPSDSLVEERAVFGPDYHQHSGDPRVASKRRNRMVKNSGAREREILFG
jgi:hypothetical protein